MALFGWLSPKTKPQAELSALANGANSATSQNLTDPDEPTVPGPGQDPARRSENAAIREQMRTAAMARREQLYTVVRDCLMQEGMMATSYKFKVLALDQGGRQYLVMVDLSPTLTKSPTQLTVIESLIAKGAKARHEITVLGTYWRVNEQLRESAAPALAAQTSTPTVAPAVAAAAPVVAAAPVAAPAAPAPEASAAANPRYEPLQSEEMLAFKRALAATGNAAPVANAPRPAPRSYSPLATGYEDTQVVSPDTRPPGLGTTQFGGA